MDTIEIFKFQINYLVFKNNYTLHKIFINSEDIIAVGAFTNNTAKKINKINFNKIKYISIEEN